MEKLLPIVKFALVSGAGLALDFIAFLMLIRSGVEPFAANALSGTGAVTFVYFASVRRVFYYHGGFLFGLFLAYLAYQAVAVTAASAAVAFLAQRFVPAALAKVLILPVTFTANYLFMTLLTKHGRRTEPRSSGNPPAAP